MEAGTSYQPPPTAATSALASCDTSFFTAMRRHQPLPWKILHTTAQHTTGRQA